MAGEVEDDGEPFEAKDVTAHALAGRQPLRDERSPPMGFPHLLSIPEGAPSAWWALNTPDNPRWGNTSDPVVRGLIRYSQYLDRTVFFGEGFGDETALEGLIAGAVTQCRQGKITAEQAAQMAQQNLEAGYQKYLSGLKK